MLQPGDSNPVKAVKDPNGQARIKCPGCGYDHALNTDPSNGRPCWGFNGDLDRPTFSPSLLCRTGHFVPGQPPAEQCNICLECARDGQPTVCSICHSYIRDGMIEFLPDSTHALAGQTVPLPEIA